MGLEQSEPSPNHGGSMVGMGLAGGGETLAGHQKGRRWAGIQTNAGKPVYGAGGAEPHRCDI